MRRPFLILLAVMLAFSAACAAVPAHAADLTPEDRARLQAQYDELQQEIVQWQQILDDTQAKKNSLQGDVTALNALIKKATAEIKQRNITITTLANEINQKNQTIGVLEAKLADGKLSLAHMLRIQHSVDTMSLAEIILSNQDFSTLFGDVDSLVTLQGKLSGLFHEIQATKTQTETEKQALADKQNQELDAKYEVETTKKQIAQSEAEKQKLLSITKNAEAAYQNVLADRQRKAEQIRSTLFDLRDAQGIPFGTALQYATAASQSSGVRPAIILAILSQESDLGKNVGQCYVTNLATGDGAGKNTGTAYQKVMKAPRDTDPFQRITSAIGVSWAISPVSCPLGKTYTASRGYGGAMGPSQFIPSTWELYEPRLSSALNISQPNPWNPADAIMATAFYMQDRGASVGTYTAERNAACKYYSGRACDTAKPTNYTYGDSVMKKAEQFQSDIDFLKGV